MKHFSDSSFNPKSKICLGKLGEEKLLGGYSRQQTSGTQTDTATRGASSRVPRLEAPAQLSAKSKIARSEQLTACQLKK